MKCWRRRDSAPVGQFDVGTNRQLQIVPDGAAPETLAADYANMLADEVPVGNTLSFGELMRACAELAARVNSAAGL